MRFFGRRSETLPDYDLTEAEDFPASVKEIRVNTPGYYTPRTLPVLHNGTPIPPPPGRDWSEASEFREKLLRIADKMLDDENVKLETLQYHLKMSGKIYSDIKNAYEMAEKVSQDYTYQAPKEVLMRWFKEFL